MDFLLKSLNGHLQAYYTSPRITIDVRKAAEIMSSDWYGEWISYKRGLAFLLFIDLYLRRQTGQNDIMSNGPLDKIIIDLSRRCRNGKIVRAQQWLESLTEYLGSDKFPIAQQYEGMLRGRHIIDFEGLSFDGGSQKLKECRLPIMEFGFDRSSVHTRIVSGVIPNSPAAVAGLWNGAHIIRTSRAGLCVEDLRNTYTVVVKDGDEDRPIQFLPRLLDKTASA